MRHRRSIPLEGEDELALVAGVADENLKLLESTFGILAFGGQDGIAVEGSRDDVEAACLVLEDMADAARQGERSDPSTVRRLVSQRQRSELSRREVTERTVLESRLGPVRPKTVGQRRYVDSIASETITFGIGPAGTGKTYLAMACAIASLGSREVGRIVLSRPILEAGESLGYLPGTLTEKVDPYIRPLYDALFDMVDRAEAESLLRDGTIEVAPLAFMRGRTLNDAFVILDEAQNATPEQLKMFLTRLGSGSKMVITGDLTQSDLGKGRSGLPSALSILEGIEGIGICRLGSADVVRNPLVSAIIAAYEEGEER